MDDLLSLFFFFLVLGFILALITLIGHGIWVAIAWSFRALAGKPSPLKFESLNLDRCANCNALLHPQAEACSACGWRKASHALTELMKEVGAARRVLQRLHRQGNISETAYSELMRALYSEKERLSSPTTHAPRAPEATPAARPQTHTTPDIPVQPTPPPVQPPASVTEIPIPISTPPASAQIREETFSRVDAFAAEAGAKATEPRPHSWAEEETGRPVRQAPAPARQPRKPLTEVLAAFMEQSNIRWGEIIGGLLIIGCSTALVISLWNEISRIPVLKFFIFTTVTAALFGVGLYTEHRWKLPTTSRGILTIATLLVPLNFLAIAAVSKGALPGGVLIVSSELIAPALFLCLVYFAGRIITPRWPQLLAFGVLSASVGQLLVRHFASAEMPPAQLFALGLFPLICYDAAITWMLRRAGKEEEFDESLANNIFATLGATTFAALLSLGLLVFKAGAASETSMHLAPLLTLGGGPILACGLLLWQRVKSRELAASRTAGTAIALIGSLFLLAGIVLSFPNPASVIPAALFAFLIFTGDAIYFKQPRAHLFAAFSFALAFLVTALALSGQVAWQSPRHTSLVNDLLTIRSGQAMAVLFALYIAISEILRSRKREVAGRCYLWGAVVVGVACLAVVTLFGLGRAGDSHFAAPIFLLLTAGAFFIAWRMQSALASWIGSGVLLLALRQTLGMWLAVRFSWEAALLMHASIAAVAAIICWRKGEPLRRIYATPLNAAALIASLGALAAMLESYQWQPTALYAQRLFWLALVWLVLLWLNRVQLLFVAMQVALTCAVLLVVKLGLQNSEWYAYLPNAWLHPWSLQIQGSVLVLLGLAWIALRIYVRRAAALHDESDAVKTFGEEGQRERGEEGTARGLEGKSEEHWSQVAATKEEHWSQVAWSYLNSAWPAFDRLLTWLVLFGFVLMGVYGAHAGVRLELAMGGGAVRLWNLAGFAHEYAYGAGAWILLALLLLAMLACFWERRRSAYLLGAVLALSVSIPLLAARWETLFATASAWRWLAAGFLLLLSLPLWWREKLARQLKSFGLPELAENEETVAGRTRSLLFILTVAPVLIFTVYAIIAAINYRPVHGAAAGFFFQIGVVASYAIPLALLSLALAGHAVRERAADYAFSAGLLVNLTVTVAQLLAVSTVGGSMNRVVLVEVMQLNAIATACFALVWLATRNWWMVDTTPAQVAQARGHLKIQVWIALLLNALVIVPLVYRLIMRPEWAGSATFEAGDVRGWLALVLSLVAACWLALAFERELKAWLLLGAASGVGALISFDATLFYRATWAGYHTLLVALALTAWLMLFARKLPVIWRQNEKDRFSVAGERRGAEYFSAGWAWETAFYASAAGVLTVLMALRASLADPQRPWWSVGALCAMSALAAMLNWETLRRSFLYAAALLLNLAATIWFVTSWPHGRHLAEDIYGFVDANIVALALPCTIWIWLELRARRQEKRGDSHLPSVHHVAAALVLGAMLWLAGSSLIVDIFTLGVNPRVWVEMLAILSAIVLMIACLWDRQARYAVAGLYLLGLAVAGRLLGRFDLTPHRLLWVLMLVLADYALLTSLMWKSRAALIEFAGRLKIPARTEAADAGLKWLGVFNAALAFVVVLMGFNTVVTYAEWPLRMIAALAVCAQLFTFGMLAEGEKRKRWQQAALFMLATGAVYLGWAWLVPGASGTWLNRAVVLMIVMFALIALNGIEAARALTRESDWAQAGRSFIPAFAVTGAIALAFVLFTEALQHSQYGGVRIGFPALAVIGLTLLSTSIMCIVFAVRPKYDPLGLTESGRMKYVYAAEGLLALLFMHVRLTMPWLFSGFFAEYWPLVIIFISFLGVGISEALRRQGVMVLAHPVERTGAFLPLLPAIGFWIVGSKVDYSLLLFMIGLLYASLSILRRSFGFGLLAAIAGNGGLWYMLHQTESYGFFQHPQMWLIPIAVSILVAAYLNRERFTEEQMAGTRYLTLMMIYVSSTSDIFINGVAESPWLPLALAGLSLAGVLCGIVMRVRAFLYLGATFLLIAVITMIRYASVNLGWTWLWWVAGIVTGALIIFTFALFEKKRGEMLQVLEDLRAWER